MSSEELKQAVLELQSKLFKISKLPKSKCGESFVGIDFDDTAIYYNTKTYYSGGGDDEYTLYIQWNEINEPLEYFVERFEKQWEAELIERRKLAELAAEARENEEKKKYEELKRKYGI